MVLERQRLGYRGLFCWSVVLCISLLSGVGIAALAPRMTPVREGSSHVFWRIASGVSLSPELATGMGGEAYFVDDTWAAYELYHMHGSDLYRVPVKEVSADFDAVVAELQKAVQAKKDTLFLRTYVSWRDDHSLTHTGPTLLESSKRARSRKWANEDVDFLTYSVAREQQFWQRWQRVNWYWANILFEWVFLSGLVLFALWPVIRNQSALRWALHVAALPLLFLLPAYLGYAAFSFTSAGPSGGILYPFLLWPCLGGDATEVDTWLLARLPQILEPLSTPIGSPTALTGMGMPGPTYAVLEGIIASAAMFAILSGGGWWIRRRRATVR